MSQTAPEISPFKNLAKIANRIRINVVRMIHRAGSGHPAGSLGMADVFTTLYFAHLKHNPSLPNWKNRDFVFLSNGHICPVWYATLAEAGYFPTGELMSLRKLGSRLQGHPHINSAPGIENTSGPLGQGISVACGLAQSLKMDQRSNQVFCFMSDGEMQEGQVWEALMFAAQNKLGNLSILIDRNHIQISGKTEDVMKVDPLEKKIASFGWETSSIDGHNYSQIKLALEQTQRMKIKPLAILCNTIPGKGVSFMENRYEWHGKQISDTDLSAALKELSELLRSKLRSIR